MGRVDLGQTDPIRFEQAPLPIEHEPLAQDVLAHPVVSQLGRQLQLVTHRPMPPKCGTRRHSGKQALHVYTSALPLLLYLISSAPAAVSAPSTARRRSAPSSGPT
eukprot:5856950-Prymnesium_polylepis.2